MVRDARAVRAETPGPSRERDVTASGDRGPERASRLAPRERQVRGSERPGSAAVQGHDDCIAGRSDGLGRAAGALVLRRSAAVLGALIAEVAAIGRRVGDVPRPGIVKHGFADLGEIGSEPMNEHQDEEHPHETDDTSGGEAAQSNGAARGA
jgi:hypothetical protein